MDAFQKAFDPGTNRNILLSIYLSDKLLEKGNIFLNNFYYLNLRGRRSNIGFFLSGRKQEKKSRYRDKKFE